MKPEDRDLVSTLVMGLHEYGQRLGRELADTAEENMHARHYYEKAIMALGVPIPRYSALSDVEREDVQGWGSRGIRDVISRHLPTISAGDEEDY